MDNFPPFTLRDETLETEVKFMQKVAALVRSTRADYNLANKTRTDLYLRIFCAETAAMLGRHTAAIATLAACHRVTILVTEEPPQGCAIITVSDKVNTEFNRVFSCEPKIIYLKKQGCESAFTFEFCPFCSKYARSA
jgi:valyl-tRNA synthetase